VFMSREVFETLQGLVGTHRGDLLTFTVGRSCGEGGFEPSTCWEPAKKRGDQASACQGRDHGDVRGVTFRFMRDGGTALVVTAWNFSDVSFGPVLV